MELFGLLLPIVIDLINRKIADTDLRFWVSVGVCAIVGTFLNYLNTLFVFGTPLMAFESITGSIVMVFGLAQFSYKAIWSRTDYHTTLVPQSTTK